MNGLSTGARAQLRVLLTGWCDVAPMNGRASRTSSAGGACNCGYD
jgi:hypothetical protein